MKRLICACCGSGTIGKQWWNRDHGYGLCAACVPFILKHGSTIEELEHSYGKIGVHCGIEEKEPAAEPTV